VTLLGPLQAECLTGKAYRKKIIEKTGMSYSCVSSFSNNSGSRKKVFFLQTLYVHYIDITLCKKPNALAVNYQHDSHIF